MNLRSKFARTHGYSRSSTATERLDASGRCGFDSHRERQFRRAVEFGLSGIVPLLRDERVRPPCNRATDCFPSRSLSVVDLGPGRCTSVIEPVAQLRQSIPANGKMRVRFPSGNIEVVPCPSLHSNHFSTGRRIGLSFINAWSRVRVPPLAPNAGVAQW